MHAAVRQFSDLESFVNKDGDGQMLGTDLLENIHTSAVCILATGSPVEDLDQDYIAITKPFSLAGFIKAMEQGINQSLISLDLLVQKDGALLINNTQLYRRADE
jgi:hypothetical protein